ncbi:MAG TPA: N-acetyltransferase [Patescibacteria group bacterium]|nr:N-acetyltransferase [Patescibacteria group bacterium]
MKRRKQKRSKLRIQIRQMILEDVSGVWHLGQQLFTPSSLQYTYRTWNTDELLSLFNNDPELCLVAEDSSSEKIVGFSLGMILKRPFSPWTYGYFIWAGVRKTLRKRGIGPRLYRELEKRLRLKGARIVIVDVEGSNPAGIQFVKKLGFEEAQTYFWFSKNLEQ